MKDLVFVFYGKNEQSRARKIRLGGLHPSLSGKMPLISCKFDRKTALIGK